MFSAPVLLLKEQKGTFLIALKMLSVLICKSHIETMR